MTTNFYDMAVKVIGELPETSYYLYDLMTIGLITMTIGLIVVPLIIIFRKCF